MIILDTNLVNKATSQYLLNINSMVKFNQDFLCASENGLFKFEGTIDGVDSEGVDVDIDSYFKTMTIDFGINSEKRLRFVYVGYEASSSITMTIATEDGASDVYILPATTDLQAGYRITISRKLHGRYFTFTFAGINFSIDQIDVLPIIRGHFF